MAFGKKKGKGKHSGNGASSGVSSGSTWHQNTESNGNQAGNSFGVSTPTSSWSDSSWSAPTPAQQAAEVKRATDNLIEKKRKRKKLKKGIAIFFGVLVGLIALAYAAGCWFFSTHFYPQSTVAGIDVSLKSADEAANELSGATSDYKLHVQGVNDFAFDFVPEDTTFSLDTATIAQSALRIYPCWAWPYELTQSHDLSQAVEATFEDEGTKQYVEEVVNKYNEGATKPTNATIGYVQETNSIGVIEEKLGTAYNAEAVTAQVKKAVCCLQDTLVLTDAELQQPEVTKDDPRLAEAAKEASEFLGADLQLMLGDTKVGEINAEQIAQWVTVSKDYKPTLSKKKMTAWVKELAKSCDTVGTKRSFTNPAGDTFTVSGGDYGWAVDTNALVTAVKKAVEKGDTGKLDIPCSTKADTYNGEGKADWGDRYIEVNLKKQKATFWDGGKAIWSTKIVSGIPDGTHDTPSGVFDINQKASPQKLIGYENGKKIYESKVKFWMPFDGNAIGFHDATWQAAFGGTRYKDGYGSHGCVNLSYSKASELYKIIKVGDVVVVHW